MRRDDGPMPLRGDGRKGCKAKASSEGRAPTGLNGLERKRGTKGSRIGRHLHSKFTPSTANEARLIGLAIGVLSLFLPWASVARIENGSVRTTASYNLIDLLLLGDPTTALVAAAYMAGVTLALLYASSVIIVLLAWFVQDDIIRAYLMSTVPATTPDVTYSVLFGIGSWLGLLVAFLLIVSIVAWFRGERYIPKDLIMPSEIYHRGTGKPGFWGNVNYFAYFTRLNERRRCGRP